MSIQATPAYNQGNGTQLRDAFRAINERLGSEIVTNIHNIINTRYRHPYRASGRQLRTAFEQLNTHFGKEVVDLKSIQNITDGKQLFIAFEAINTAIALAPTTGSPNVIPPVTAPLGIFTELSDWEPIPGSPANVLSKPADRIRVSANGGVLDGIKTIGTYHFDPNKWYRVTVHMEIDVAGNGKDHDGGQFSVEMKGHDFDHVDATLGWGVAGGVLSVSPSIQTILIHPHTAETQAHFRVLGMGIAGDPMEIVLIKVEEFDSNPDAVSPIVVLSDIPADHPDTIVVTWDKPMAATGNLVSEIDVIIGTAAPINPTHVVFHGNDMTLSFADAFVSGAKVTWAYDDSNPHVQLHDADGNEAENQTYVVTNHVLALVIRFDMLATAPAAPAYAVVGGTLQTKDNGDGTYSVTSTDKITKITSIRKDETAVTVNKALDLTDASQMFRHYSHLTSVDVSGLTAVTNATNMFEYCTHLTSVDLTAMTSVTDASGMFGTCDHLTSADLSGMTSLINASSMFNWCTALISVDASGLTAITNASSMFNLCTELTCIKSIDTRKVTSVDRMFATCFKLTAPNTAEQGQIAHVPGILWTNPNPCP